MTIHLRDHAFVDYLIARDEEERKFIAMRPDYAIEQLVESDPDLSYRRFHSLLQHEIKRIDAHFPYPDLTLGQVGIPAWDVLYVSAGQTEHYVELADERHYSGTLSKSEQP